MVEISVREYRRHFPGHAEGSIGRTALTQAHENRKFEIDLYWKRATYCWTFIAAAFAGYFLLQKEAANSTTISFVVACLGFTFSLSWYFVNRGSKYWQQNWEMHVDLLEDRVTGPIYKTVVQPRSYCICRISDAYPFSVSKINQLLSFYITVVWLVLIVRALVIEFNVAILAHHLIVVFMFVFTVFSAACIGIYGQTEHAEEDDHEIRRLFRRRRTLVD